MEIEKLRTEIRNAVNALLRADQLLAESFSEPVLAFELEALLTQLEASGESWRIRDLTFHLQSRSPMAPKERKLPYLLTRRGWTFERRTQGIYWTPPVNS